MRRGATRVLLLLGALALLLFGVGVRAVVVGQGGDPDEWEKLADGRARAEPDARGIPTIEAADWPSLFEAQGYVTASERLFQMDLMRRSATGRLAAWFGRAALEHDQKRWSEDWSFVAERAAQLLPEDERQICEAYARGVNRFIESQQRKWGLEYWILRTSPAPWRCSDTMSIVLLMCDQLSNTAPTDALLAAWSSRLPEAWSAFIFPENHPWNEPLFGERQPPPRAPTELSLPYFAISPEELENTNATETSKRKLAERGAPSGHSEPAGSNSWAYCGKRGCFLANDPHLGASVPHLWFAARLRVSADDWVIGVTLPGVPGVVIGRNPSLAWGFTNVEEDVDDYVSEKISPDGRRYVASVGEEGEVWEEIEEKTSLIEVRDEAPVSFRARFTRRGPLAKRAHMEGEASRQWLPLRPGLLRLPIRFNRAESWDAMNVALDSFRVPAQNVLIMENGGAIGYRASGTGIIRRASGRVPQRFPDGEWAGYQPPDSRPRLRIEAKTGTEAYHLATANERIWVEPFANGWADDARRDRIRRVLKSGEELGRSDMSALQRDTESRYHRMLLGWVGARAQLRLPEDRSTVERWKKWNGLAESDALTFTEALEIDTRLTHLLIGRVRRHFPAIPDDLPYTYRLKRAWVIVMLEDRDGARVFGVDPEELATHLLTSIRSRTGPLYPEQNRWRAQHPFATRIFFVGRLFRVAEPLQMGHAYLVKMEMPTFGASVRIVWDANDPLESSWSLPVGQSGHAGRPHYSDLQESWHAGRPFPVFDPAYTWNFRGRAR